MLYLIGTNIGITDGIDGHLVDTRLGCLEAQVYLGDILQGDLLVAEQFVGLTISTQDPPLLFLGLLYDRNMIGNLGVVRCNHEISVIFPLALQNDLHVDDFILGDGFLGYDLFDLDGRVS